MTALLLGGVVAALTLVTWVWWKLHRAAREIDALLKTTQQLEQENQQLQIQKAVVETQVQHLEARKKNEQISRSFDRAAVIEQLRRAGDLRD